jgi:hypothetical protein
VSNMDGQIGEFARCCLLTCIRAGDQGLSTGGVKAPNMDGRISGELTHSDTPLGVSHSPESRVFNSNLNTGDPHGEGIILS